MWRSAKSTGSEVRRHPGTATEFSCVILPSGPRFPLPALTLLFSQRLKSSRPGGVAPHMASGGQWCSAPTRPLPWRRGRVGGVRSGYRSQVRPLLAQSSAYLSAGPRPFRHVLLHLPAALLGAGRLVPQHGHAQRMGLDAFW